MSAPTTAQYAGLAALREGEQYCIEMVAEYDRRRKTIVAGLNAIGLPTFEPQGAFYAFPRIAHLGLSSEEFCERLLQEQHVAIIPGNVFGPSGDGFARACYAASMDKIAAALDRIERFVRSVS
jgi:aminotransferase